MAEYIPPALIQGFESSRIAHDVKFMDVSGKALMEFRKSFAPKGYKGVYTKVPYRLLWVNKQPVIDRGYTLHNPQTLILIFLN